jgi:hypothetical protein
MEFYRPKLRLRFFLGRRRFRERDSLSAFRAIDGKVPFVWFNMTCHDESPIPQYYMSAVGSLRTDLEN